MADAALVKNLKIKTGVVKRLTKERVCYVKEANQQDEKVKKLKAENGDEYMIRKQEEVLQECRSMIPDCGRRLQTAVEELELILNTETSLTEAPEFAAAKTAVAEGRTTLAN